MLLGNQLEYLKIDLCSQQYFPVYSLINLKYLDTFNSNYVDVLISWTGVFPNVEYLRTHKTGLSGGRFNLMFPNLKILNIYRFNFKVTTIHTLIGTHCIESNCMSPNIKTLLLNYRIVNRVENYLNVNWNNIQLVTLKILYGNNGLTTPTKISIGTLILNQPSLKELYFINTRSHKKKPCNQKDLINYYFPQYLEYDEEVVFNILDMRGLCHLDCRRFKNRTPLLIYGVYVPDDYINDVKECKFGLLCNFHTSGTVFHIR